ncbi:PorT family protein [Salinimicrobium sp. CDJ15-81-2]|nr:PorT family protein [Salinimicrobium nanhaiense]
MKEKKYIDRLYQEKFRDFEAAPRDVVWRSIAAKLREEEKKPTVVPLWSRMAGVAAILAFLLLIGDWILPNQPGTAVANEETRVPASSPTTQPQNTRLSVIPLEIEAEAEPVAEAVPKITLPSTPLQQEKKEKRVAELSAIEIASKNAIFDTYEPIAPVGATVKIQNKLPEEKENLLLEAIKDDETEVAASTPKKGFEISTHAAPIYYGNMGKGNFIDPRFNRNNSEGEMTYSYGVKIAYNLNEKFKIRSGINKVNMSYNTEGVAFQAVAGKSPIKNISLENSSSVTSTLGGKNGGRTPAANTNRTDVAYIRPGELNQKTGYLEIPLELEYNLFASKFELNLIGGASTLFLAENEILLNAETVSLEGKANNLNNVSFSTNIGLGLDYNLSEKFKLNLEPMLKYQINTFENASPDTRPYYFGIYSGFSYKF